MTKKIRFIESNNLLSQPEKDQIIAFFNKHPNYENQIDWNKKSLNFKDFLNIMKKAENSKKKCRIKAKLDPKSLFSRIKCQIICETKDFLIIVPSNRKAVIFFNSHQCGGEGARWCIGGKRSNRIWKNYLASGAQFYFVYFINRNKLLGKKMMIEYDDIIEDFKLWLQNGCSVSFHFFGYYLMKNFCLASKDNNGKQLLLEFYDDLFDTKKFPENDLLLQLVKKTYEDDE